MDIISAIDPDWTREEIKTFWDPGRKLLRSIRKYQYWCGKKGFLAKCMQKLWVIPWRFWSVVSGAEIHLTCKLGGGLLIPHPNGIVIHPDAVIGVNCLIFQQVTIGGRSGVGIPRVGGHVDIGAGAKILGGVCIGNHARIGANAVVITDIPECVDAVGIPAKVRNRE